jgi:glycosyltransferase involved in cell wall biosynthesis
VVGRMRWHRKGQEVVVRAASILRERYPLARFVLVGSAAAGEEQEEFRLQELIGVYGLQDVVTVMREPSRRDLPSLYAGLDVLVAPLLRSEPLDGTVLAAMAVGTPVVGSRCGGVSELVEYGETGLLFPAADFEQLARELDVLLDYEETRDRMVEAAKKMVGERFDWKKTAWEMSGELIRMGRRV